MRERRERREKRERRWKEGRKVREGGWENPNDTLSTKTFILIFCVLYMYNFDVMVTVEEMIGLKLLNF